MRFLIDTLIWYLDGNGKLPRKIRDKINNVDNKVVVSIVSLWELTIKIGLKKIDTTANLSEIQFYIAERQFTLLDISFEHLNKLSSLPHHHGDPFDRLLIAQALTENLTIISADKEFKAYPVNVSW